MRSQRNAGLDSQTPAVESGGAASDFTPEDDEEDLQAALRCFKPRRPACGTGALILENPFDFEAGTVATPPAQDGLVWAIFLVSLSVGTFGLLRADSLGTLAYPWGIVLSLALVALGCLRNRRELFCAALVPGLGCVAWGLFELRSPRQSIWAEAGVGALMILSAMLINRAQRHKERMRHSTVRMLFAAGGLLTLLVVIYKSSPRGELGLVLAALALLMSFSHPLFRVREIALLGQDCLVMGQLAWFWVWTGLPGQQPWWNPAIMLVLTLAVMHRWQSQRDLQVRPGVSQFLQAASALACVGLFYFSIESRIPSSLWMVCTSLLAIVFTAYGMGTRLFLIAEAGQIFLCLSIWSFARNIFSMDGSAWYPALVPVITLAVNVLTLRMWLAKATQAEVFWQELIYYVEMICGSIAVAMTFAWVLVFLPLRERFWFLTVLGAVFFVWGGIGRRLGVKLISGCFLAAAVLLLVFTFGGAESTHWPNVLAIALLGGLQQLARNDRVNFRLNSNWHDAAILIVSSSAWLLGTRWADYVSGQFGVTVAWGVVAVAALLAGWGLRERTYLQFGLMLLALSLLRAMYET